MSGYGKAVGIACIFVSAVVFVYFTLWTFVVPFVPSSSRLVILFPPRVWLLALPFVGVAGLIAIVSVFIQICSYQEGRDKVSIAKR
jgi:dolichol phosphate-mannose biosynthesis regulatory protein